MKKNLILFIALAGWLVVPQAQASWAYVPLEIRMAGAKCIVVGKIDRIVDGIERNNRTYDVGAIKVRQVLKGPKTLKEVKLMWPGPAPFALSTDIKFRKGQEGVWILYPDKEEKDVYWASFPTDFQALANLSQVKEKMKALKAIKWSKPMEGLQLGAIVEQSDLRNQKITVKGRPVKALARATAYIVLRNSGRTPTYAVNFPKDKQLTLKVIGPDGQELPVVSGNRLGGGKLAKHHFLQLMPGAIRSMGYGMSLPLITKAGEYTMELGYANKRKSGYLVKGFVWTGKLKGKATFKVK